MMWYIEKSAQNEHDIFDGHVVALGHAGCMSKQIQQFIWSVLHKHSQQKVIADIIFSFSHHHEIFSVTAQFSITSQTWRCSEFPHPGEVYPGDALKQ